jgi:hypothetical protein
MNATNVIIYLNNNFLEFYFLVKIRVRVLQTYPLKINLIPEIWTDWKRNLEIRPSALLFFPK